MPCRLRRRRELIERLLTGAPYSVCSRTTYRVCNEEVGDVRALRVDGAAREQPMYGYQLRRSSRAGPGRPGRSTSGRSTRPWPGSSATAWSRARAPTTRARGRTRSPRPGRAEVAAWFDHAGRPQAAAARRAGDQARAGGDRARGRRRAPSSSGSAPRRMRALQELHPAQARGATGDGRQRPGLAPGAGLAGLPRRGRDPLARPLRGQRLARLARPTAGPPPAPAPTTPAGWPGRRATGTADEHRPRRPVLELDDGHPHPRPGRREVHALRGVSLARPPASWSP